MGNPRFRNSRIVYGYYFFTTIVVVLSCAFALGLWAEKKRTSISNNLFVVYNGEPKPIRDAANETVKMPYDWVNTLVIFVAEENPQFKYTKEFVPFDPRTVPDFSYVTIRNASKLTTVYIKYKASDGIIPTFAEIGDLFQTIPPGKTTTICTTPSFFTASDALKPQCQLLDANYKLNFKLYDRIWTQFGADVKSYHTQNFYE